MLWRRGLRSLSGLSRGKRPLGRQHLPSGTDAPSRPLQFYEALLVSSDQANLRLWIDPARKYSSSARTTCAKPSSLRVLDKEYETDDYTNLSSTILARTNKSPQLPNMDSHPLKLLVQQIEQSLSSFQSIPPPSPVVSVEQNFGKLGFAEDHPGRSPSDTYYINRHTCLRTHTSSHQVDSFAKGYTKWLLTADVFRRDEIDASHYPIFHQMEGACIMDLDEYENGTVQRDCELMEKRLRESRIEIEDNVDLQEAGGYQKIHEQDSKHSKAAQLALRHLKATLNNLAFDLFGERHAADARVAGENGEPLKVRWIAASFPFTTPSFEIEVLFRGEWLEILGSGVVMQKILDEAGVEKKVGWAFGLGLERMAMVLFQIPDIRLFWSKDPRFLSQFARSIPTGNTQILNGTSQIPQAGVSPAGGATSPSHTNDKKMPLITFKPYSKYPPCYKDVSFWLPKGASVFHENDVFEVIRDVAGDLTENVALIDDFVHPKSGRHSKCFRINYRSMDRSLENEEVNVIHSQVSQNLVDILNVELR